MSGILHLPRQLHNSLWQPVIVFSAVAMAVLLPLMSSGYILTLDLTFTPQLHAPSNVTSSYLLSILLHTVNFVLPADVIEKLLLFGILLASGLGAYILAKNITPKTPKNLGLYFTGLLYTINPFTYDRFMAGQYNLLLGYALLPWFTTALLNFLAKPAWRQTAILTVLAIVIGIVSIHTIGMMVILFIAAIAMQTWQHRTNKARLVKLWRFALLTGALFFIASSYWLVPLMLGHGDTSATINAISTNDRAAFSTLGGNALGKTINVLHMEGFWAEGRGLYTLPQSVSHSWDVLTCLLWLLVVTGAIALWRANRRFVVTLLGISALLATILATGMFNGWLATHLPLFSGYREPQKFVGLIALGYAVFAGFGVATVQTFLQKNGGKVLLVIGSSVLLLLPLAWTPTMLWGFDNQLAPAQYPTSWTAVNTRLDSDPSTFKVLFLPWHQYMYFSFAGRIIANPAPQFFDKPTLVSNDPQFGGITPPPNATDEAINKLLVDAPNGAALGQKLGKLHIKYVILDNDDDYRNYSYLFRQRDLKVVFKSNTLVLLRNEAYGK